MDDLEEKIRERELITQFMETPLFENLEARRAQDERISTAQLLKLDPYKYTTLADLQNAIAKIQENVILARKVNAYFGDAILEGNEAEAQLDMQED